jgi:hypothetical protein
MQFDGGTPSDPYWTESGTGQINSNLTAGVDGPRSYCFWGYNGDAAVEPAGLTIGAYTGTATFVTFAMGWTR